MTHLPGGLIPCKQVIGDGNCLPRSILLAMTGSQESHAELRKSAIDCIRENASCFLSDIQLLGYSTVQAYCSKMSKNAEFGDVVMLMACCITENVSIQLFTWNSHASHTKSVQTLSSQTFLPSTSSSRLIQIHLDTGDTHQGIEYGSHITTPSKIGHRSVTLSILPPPPKTFVAHLQRQNLYQNLS